MKRVFLIVLDSFGIGELPDANKWNDQGSNTLASIAKHANFVCPNLTELGLFNIEGVFGNATQSPRASFARMLEQSNGKDTTIGHWEIAGIISKKPLPTFPNGFPNQIIDKFEKATKRKVLCNKPYSGTEVIKDFGKEHMETGALIVYTSADSVFQIAAHEDIVPIKELYQYCEIARNILQGDYAVGRIIARPFVGEYPFERTSNRHDFSLQPKKQTMLDCLMSSGLDTIAVGKIYDIFAGKGISESHKTINNEDGMRTALSLATKDFCGLCFVNLVDFDMLYGHRNDVAGYAKAMSDFDAWLPTFQKTLRDEDVVIVTADHGCDPSTPSTDHSREYTPMLIFGDGIKSGVNLGTRDSFADIAASILEYFSIPSFLAGKSFYQAVKK